MRNTSYRVILATVIFGALCTSPALATRNLRFEAIPAKGLTPDLFKRFDNPEIEIDILTGHPPTSDITALTVQGVDVRDALEPHCKLFDLTTFLGDDHFVFTEPFPWTPPDFCPVLAFSNVIPITVPMEWEPRWSPDRRLKMPSAWTYAFATITIQSGAIFMEESIIMRMRECKSDCDTEV